MLIQLRGSEKDTRSNSFQTNVVGNNGFNPTWDEVSCMSSQRNSSSMGNIAISHTVNLTSVLYQIFLTLPPPQSFTLSITAPDLALLVLRVMDSDVNADDFVAQVLLQRRYSYKYINDNAR